MDSANDIDQVKTRRASREDVIIQTAAELYPQRGIEPVKMTDVAEASGVGVASLYRYFGTKVNLAIEAGALLWRRFREGFEGNLTAEYGDKTGYGQMEELYGLYITMYRSHPELIAFLDELDHMVLATKPEEDRLRSYDDEIMRLYAMYEAAFRKGVADCTIRPDVNFPLFYQTSSHALMGIAQKLIRGEVLPSDDFSQGWVELQMAVNLALGYLKG